MNRVQIIGPSGAGKTYLSRQLSNKLDIPAYELDLLFWLPEWKEKPKVQYDKDIENLVNKDRWVICGNYLDRTGGATLKRATHVIWLNYKPRVYVSRMIKRTTKRIIAREKLWGHLRENGFNFIFRPKKSVLWLTIALHRREGHRRYDDKLKKYGYKGIVIELSSPKDTEDWLSRV